jgi:hypothetical protein
MSKSLPVSNRPLVIARCNWDVARAIRIFAMLATIGKPSFRSGSRKPIKLLLSKADSTAARSKFTGDTVPLPPVAVLKSGAHGMERATGHRRVAFSRQSHCPA